MENAKDMGEMIKESFTQYSGAVIQSRALVDVRDCLKPSARQIEYCLFTDKFLPNKPFKKTLKAIGSIARLYIHGDSSAEGIMMRSGQEFAMRYPLTEVEGNNGNLMQSGNWAAPRYTATRLSQPSVNLFKDIDKDTIEEWRDNYDDTEKYPAVLPSKGFYNIVNGTQGIGVGVASSIPQFNLKEVNAAMEKLLLNPNAAFEDIYCCPDFATGAQLINEEEVKVALKYGSKGNAKKANEEGASCKLRAVIDYDKKNNCLVVTEIPYSVYTNTICQQLEAILEDKEMNPGIDRFNDLTGEKPLIKIYLMKGANPDGVTQFLYNNTSLQYHFGINMTMLDKGRYPKVFSWKEALQAHIDHEVEVYTRGYKFDLKKIKDRIHIIDGLLVCVAAIDEVIQEIKSSSSSSEAKERLMAKYHIDEAQAKAVLGMKLASLAKLEIQKLEQEKTELQGKAEEIEKILNNRDELNKIIIEGWRKTSAQLGDERRTQVVNVPKPTKEEKEMAEIPSEECVVVLTQSGFVKRVPTSSFRVQRKGGKGVKSKDDVIMDTIKTNTVDYCMFFTSKGKMYRVLVNNIPDSTASAKGVLVRDLVKLDLNENVVAMSSLHRKSLPEYIVFVTKKGMIKKSYLKEYLSTNRNSGVLAMKLKEDDEVVKALYQDDEEIIMISHKGYGIRFKAEEVSATGRASGGVKGMKLDDDDYIVSALSVHKYTDYIGVFNVDGTGKQFELHELTIQKRGGKGLAVTTKEAEVAGAAMLSDNDVVLVSGSKSSICVAAKEISKQTRATLGSAIIKTPPVQSITKI